MVLDPVNALHNQGGNADPPGDRHVQ